MRPYVRSDKFIVVIVIYNPDMELSEGESKTQIQSPVLVQSCTKGAGIGPIEIGILIQLECTAKFHFIPGIPQIHMIVIGYFSIIIIEIRIATEFMGQSNSSKVTGRRILFAKAYSQTAYCTIEAILFYRKIPRRSMGSVGLSIQPAQSKFSAWCNIEPIVLGKFLAIFYAERCTPGRIISINIEILRLHGIIILYMASAKNNIQILSIFLHHSSIESQARQFSITAAISSIGIAAGAIVYSTTNEPVSTDFLIIAGLVNIVIGSQSCIFAHAVATAEILRPYAIIIR